MIYVDIKFVSFRDYYHRLLHIDLLTSGQTKVGYLGHKVVSHQDVPGCQVSVDELEITRDLIRIYNSQEEILQYVQR